MHPNAIVNCDLDTIVADLTIDWERFVGKRVLVSGANGFLAAYVVEVLLHLDIDVEVVALVRNESKALARFAHHAGDGRLRLLVQDVCESVDVAERIDFIFHAASQASPRYYGTDPVGTMLANTIGTWRMLELARAHGVEGMLNFSSGEVYGDSSKEFLTEADYGYIDICNVRSCYGESKRAGETMCVSYWHQHGVRVRNRYRIYSQRNAVEFARCRQIGAVGLECGGRYKSGFL